MNEDATTPETVDTSLSIPVIIIELVPSRKASSPIETSSEDVVNAVPTLSQGLLSLENARVSPI